MNEIIRGTTPTFVFEMPFDSSILASVYFIVKQEEKTVIEKSYEKWESSGKDISVLLTQEETLKLSCDSYAAVNLVMKTLGEDRHETIPEYVKVVETSKNEVI